MSGKMKPHQHDPSICSICALSAPPNTADNIQIEWVGRTASYTAKLPNGDELRSKNGIDWRYFPSAVKPDLAIEIECTEAVMRQQQRKE
jgi:hypothetical protein